MQNNECIRAKWKGKSMDVFSSCYSSVSVDFVCDRYSLEESKCKKSFDFACDCSFMPGTMQQRRTQDDGSRWICLLYTSDAADEEDSVDLGGRRIITKNNKKQKKKNTKQRT